MTGNRTDTSTLSALSAMASIGACVAHEVIGHGGACVATGAAVTLLTTVHFKCFPSPPIVDAAGPSMNLVVAFAAAAALRLQPGSASTRGFLALLLAFARGTPPVAVAPVPRSGSVQVLGLCVVVFFWLIQGRGYQAPDRQLGRNTTAERLT